MITPRELCYRVCNSASTVHPTGHKHPYTLPKECAWLRDGVALAVWLMRAQRGELV